MSVERDIYGKARIPLGPPLNPAGFLEIDGDEMDEAPVAILRLQLASDRIGSDPDSELDYGSFQIAVSGSASLQTGLMLDERSGRDLIEQLSWQLRPLEQARKEEETALQGNPPETLADFTSSLDGLLQAAVSLAPESEIAEWLRKRLRAACNAYLDWLERPDS